jgi:hypothetical protein
VISGVAQSAPNCRTPRSRAEQHHLTTRAVVPYSAEGRAAKLRPVSCLGAFTFPTEIPAVNHHGQA